MRNILELGRAEKYFFILNLTIQLERRINAMITKGHAIRMERKEQLECYQFTLLIYHFGFKLIQGRGKFL